MKIRGKNKAGFDCFCLGFSWIHLSLGEFLHYPLDFTESVTLQARFSRIRYIPESIKSLESRLAPLHFHLQDAFFH